MLLGGTGSCLGETRAILVGFDFTGHHLHRRYKLTVEGRWKNRSEDAINQKKRLKDVNELTWNTS